MADKLCDALLECIDASYHFEVSLGRDETCGISRSSIELKFNEETLHTIDIGCNKKTLGTVDLAVKASKATAVACTFLALDRKVYLNKFEISKKTPLEKILEFVLSTGDDRCRALNLLLELAKVELGNLSFLKRNCGDLVETTIKIIFSKKRQENEEKTRNSEEQQEEIDFFSQRFGNRVRNRATTTALSTGAIVLGIGYGVFKALSSEKRRQKENR